MKPWTILAPTLLAICIGCNPPEVTSDFPRPLTGQADKAIVVILRAHVVDSIWAGIMVQVDGRRVANLGVNYRLEIALPPGVHSFSIPGGNQTLTMGNGETYYLLITAGERLPLSVASQSEVAIRITETKVYASNM